MESYVLFMPGQGALAARLKWTVGAHPRGGCFVGESVAFESHSLRALGPCILGLCCC